MEWEGAKKRWAGPQQTCYEVLPTNDEDEIPYVCAKRLKPIPTWVVSWVVNSVMARGQCSSPFDVNFKQMKGGGAYWA